jgi:Uma2 family endonuclease
MTGEDLVTHIGRETRTLAHTPLPNDPNAEQHMAMPAINAHRWTADEVRALPDEPGKRFECVDGELLVSPSPRLPHQSAVGFLHEHLAGHCRAHRVGAAFMAPGDVELDRFTLVQPDVFVLPLVDGRRPRTAEEIGHPLLFIEVLSPSTARYDRVVKRGRYQRYGVEYWIVDLDARLLERWLPQAEQPFIQTESVRWEPSGEAVLEINLVALFEDALGAP